MTTRFSGTGGRVTHLHGHHVGPPPSFDKVEGSDFTLEADLVLLAMGFLHCEQPLLEQFGVDRDPRNNVASIGHATSVPGVFTAGDAHRGQSLIVWGIAEGRQAARAADRYLDGLEGEGEDLIGALIAG